MDNRELSLRHGGMVNLRNWQNRVHSYTCTGHVWPGSLKELYKFPVYMNIHVRVYMNIHVRIHMQALFTNIY